MKPSFTLQHIKARATPNSFSRGESYYHNEAISDTVQRGDQIGARCQGSMEYEVSAYLNSSGIVKTSCTCEYSGSGDCKHIVALLLTYLDDPSRFVQRPTLSQTLASFTPNDLKRLIEYLVEQEPHLHKVIDEFTALKTADTSSTERLIRQKIKSAFDQLLSHSYDEKVNYNQLRNLIHSAEKWIEQDQWLQATQIYGLILEAFSKWEPLSYFEEIEDLFSIIQQSLSRLDDALLQPILRHDLKTRKRIFQAMLGTYFWEIDSLDLSVGDDIPDILLKHLQTAEIPFIRKQLETLCEDNSLQICGDFLTILDILSQDDPEGILHSLCENGFDTVLLDKLLEYGRIEEALDLVRENLQRTKHLLTFLKLFVKHEHKHLAVQCAEEAINSAYNSAINDWLIDYYQAVDLQKQLHWLRKKLEREPYFAHYLRYKQAAQKLHQWDELRLETIQMIKELGQYATLTQIYLDQEQWQLAWDTLPKASTSNSMVSDLEFEVAQASRKAMPKRACPVYLNRAEQYIEMRTRHYYAQAAMLLKEAKQMCYQLGHAAEWKEFIVELRQKYKRMTALQDELDKVRL
ncbi:MAG: SWIM zinc finger family protein [Anaerolineae bacterium]|nr:SWIM zinc finger family protein [Anaerolineae bacterium]